MFIALGHLNAVGHLNPGSALNTMHSLLLAHLWGAYAIPLV